MRNREYHNIKAIYNREMLTTFSSPMAVIFFFVFAVTCGYFFTSPFFLVGHSELRGLFSIIPIIFNISASYNNEYGFKGLELRNDGNYDNIAYY